MDPSHSHGRDLMPGLSSQSGRLLALGVAIPVAIYSVMGIAMAADLQGPGYRTAAWIYLVFLTGSIAVIVWAVVVSWRAAGRHRVQPSNDR